MSDDIGNDENEFLHIYYEEPAYRIIGEMLSKHGKAGGEIYIHDMFMMGEDDYKYLHGLAGEFGASFGEVTRLYKQGMPVEDITQLIQRFPNDLWHINYVVPPIDPTFVECLAGLTEATYWRPVRRFAKWLTRILGRINRWLR